MLNNNIKKSIKYAYRFVIDNRIIDNNLSYVLDDQWLDPMPENTSFDVVKDARMEGENEKDAATETCDILGFGRVTTTYEYVGAFKGEVHHRINNTPYLKYDNTSYQSH